MGSARASHAVFRALAENLERPKCFIGPENLARKRAGRAARPATPEAGVLPTAGFSKVFQGRVGEEVHPVHGNGLVEFIGAGEIFLE